MSQVSINLPEKFPFSTEIQVRFDDLNIANHAGNDRFIAYINEAYVRFLRNYGFTDTKTMIIADLTVIYSSEAFYGEALRIDVSISDFTRSSCNFYYRMTNKKTGKEVIRARTGVVFFDYKNRLQCFIASESRSSSASPKSKSTF